MISTSVMASKQPLEAAVLKTLCYADIFDYPLTKDEIRCFLISEAKVNKNLIQSALRELPKNNLVEKENGFYSLKDRSEIIKFRMRRRKYAQEKMAIAQRVGKWLAPILSIKMVAVTGALAMENAQKADDIDLMLVTSKNRLWISRLLLVPLVSLIAKRRTPSASQKPKAKSQNSICLNLFLAETNLSIPRHKRDLYTAHEVVQIKPILSRDHTYQKFLTQNAWIKEYLPNFKIPKIHEQSMANGPEKLRNRASKWQMANSLEHLAFKLQLLYMQPKMTNELVTINSAFFHPRNTAKLVLDQYQSRLLRLGLDPKS